MRMFLSFLLEDTSLDGLCGRFPGALDTGEEMAMFLGMLGVFLMHTRDLRFL